jgi:ADP-ribose pyrophosphatase YjhB (NUDIX family)
MTIKFCLECGEPLSKNDDTCYECPDGHQYFNNPHAGASVVFLQDKKILVVQRGIEPNKGKYSFPGGFLQYGEDPADAAKREIAEETGVQLTGLELLTVATHHYQENETTLGILFLAKEWHGQFVADDDAAKLAWKPLEFLVSDDFAWHYPGLVAKLRAIVDNG